MWLIIIAILIILVIKLTKIDLNTIISAFLFSFGISYILYYAALIPIAFILMPFVSNEYTDISYINYNKPLYLLVFSFTSVFQLILSFLLFRIRRFKNGFPFLFKRYVIIIALIVAGTILMLVTLIKLLFESRDYTYYPLIILGVSIVGLGIFIWIRRGIKMFYKKWLKENNDELYEKEITEKNLEIQRLTELHETVRTANHSMNHKLSAWEHNFAILFNDVQKHIPMEISDELAQSLEEIKRLSQEYNSEISKVKVDKAIQSTNVNVIDNMFEYYASQFAENNIDFNLKVNGSIIHMIDNVIPQDKLETLIGDHLKDALIAVNANNNPICNVLAVIGAVDGCYEFKVYDSGIPFEIDTLIRLGVECVTTHKDDGGSGVGFMTTFQTMRLCGASLIIDEKEQGSSFAKSVCIRFDGLNQYVIRTYRIGEFPASDRYILESNLVLT